MLRPLTLLLALLCARRALCFTGLGLQGKVNTTNSKDYDIKCRDTYADSDPLKRSCRTMCSSWNYDKKSCCFEVFAPAKHNAGKCVAYCDQCGIELPVAVPDPSEPPPPFAFYLAPRPVFHACLPPPPLRRPRAHG